MRGGRRGIRSIADQGAGFETNRRTAAEDGQRQDSLTREADSGPAYAWRFHRAFVAPRDFGWVAQSSNTSPPVWRSPNPTRNAFRRRSGSRDWLIVQLDASTWSFAPPLQ